jgi:glycosyltransferase involved in cell wall biosynthesis
MGALQSLLRFFDGWSANRRKPRKIRFSVVINTYNRASALAKTLEVLRRQTYQEFEVVVVNGPSTDATSTILSDYAEDVKIAHCPVRKLGVSRNIGIDNAAGEIVAFIDDDAVPEFSWLEKLAIAYADPLVAAAGGYVFDVPTGRFLWRICTCTRTGDVSTDARPPVGTYLGERADPFLYLAGCNMSFRRSALVAIGGFNEAILYVYDDVDVCCRFIDKGHTIALLEDAIVYHERAQNAVRDNKGFIRDCYPLIHDKAIFSLQCCSGRPSAEDLVSRIKETASHWANAARHHIDEGTFTPVEYEHFVQRIDDAVRDGIAQGSRPRTFRKFREPRRASFHPYPTLSNFHM